jgi:hypothetical protein
MGEQSKPLFEESDKLIGHIVELMEIAIGIDVAETGANRVVHEQQIRELVPGSIVQDQLLSLHSVGSDFHQRAVLRTTARATIEPNDGPLLVGDVLVLEVPEEHVSVVLGCDPDMAARSG